MMLDVSHLLGIPYERCGNDPAKGLDCWSVAVHAFVAAGKRAPTLTRTLAGDHAWAAVCDAGRGAIVQGEPWQRVGEDLAAARELLDVVRLASPDPAGGVAVLVGLAPQRFLTAIPERGTTLRTASQLRPHVLGVYRWRGE